jgi:hypothetical protein
MELGTAEIRILILSLCGVAVVYAAATFGRLLWLHYRKPRAAAAAERREPPALDEIPAAEIAEPMAEVYSYPLPEPVVQAASDDDPGFGVHLLRTRFEQEVRQLRDEVVTLRSEIAELKTARSVSPQYADAMALAQRGLSAQDLADRCGISLGEAELVSALAHGAGLFEDEDNYGREERRTPAGRN